MIEQSSHWIGVGLLSVCAFVFVLAELVPIGLIASVAAGFGVRDGQAGYVTVVYAAVVGPAAIIVTALTAACDRRVLLLSMLAVFACANLGSALAPTYGLLLSTRAIAAIAHGVFWSIVGPYAIRLVPERHGPRALAIAFSGISLATVGGVPLGTALGIAFGWRAALGAIGLASLLACLAVLAVMPGIPRAGGAGGERPWAAGRGGTLFLVWFATLLAIGGHFAAFIYVVPFLTLGLGLGMTSTPLLLLVFGAAGLVGTFIAGVVPGGRQIDVLPLATMAFAVTGASALLLSGTGIASIAVFIIWGATISAATTLFQSSVIAFAGPAGDAASAVHVLVFNTGIGGGGFFGGLLLDEVGPRAPFLALLVTACLATATLLVAAARRPAATNPQQQG